MVTRIEIASKVFDARAEVRKQRLENLGFAKKIKDLFLVDVYTINKKFNRSELVKIASMLSNPVSQQATFRYQPPKKFNWAIEIGYLPGVTDNVANTAKEAIEDLLKIKFGFSEGVYTSQITFILGDLSTPEFLSPERSKLHLLQHSKGPAK